MAKENKTLYIILGLLQHEDLSGYDIKKKIDIMISHFWEAGYGQIYPTLKQLVENGDVLKADVESNKGPDRIVYSITDAGRNKLIQWLKIPEVNDTVRYEILLKLFFGNLVSAEDNVDRIVKFQSEQEDKLEMISQFKKNLLAVLPENQDHLYYYLTVLFGEKIYKAYLEWAQEALRLLDENV
jgi:DNA-binding PadR family transcriptional regulator